MIIEAITYDSPNSIWIEGAWEESWTHEVFLLSPSFTKITLWFSGSLLIFSDAAYVAILSKKKRHHKLG